MKANEYKGSVNTILIDLVYSVEDRNESDGQMKKYIKISPAVIHHNMKKYEMSEFEAPLTPNLRVWFNYGEYSVGENLKPGAFSIFWMGEDGEHNTVKYLKIKEEEKVIVEEPVVAPSVWSRIRTFIFRK